MPKSFTAKTAIFALSCLLVPGAVAAGQISQEFQLGKDETISFSVRLPKNSGQYSYWAKGNGHASIGIKRCAVAKKNGKLSHYAGIYDLSESPVYSSAAPAHELGCDYGFFIGCYAKACSGTFSFAVKGVASAKLKVSGSGTITGGTSKPAKPHQPQSGTVPGGDAGGQNASAALVPYNCRINGAVSKGDYDFYTFNHPGGKLAIKSKSSLNLVADLIRASDGGLVERSGVDTPQFKFGGNIAAGRYILAIRVMNHAGAGAYKVNVGKPGNCVMTETAK